MQPSFFCELRPLIRRLPAAIRTATPISGDAKVYGYARNRSHSFLLAYVEPRPLIDCCTRYCQGQLFREPRPLYIMNVSYLLTYGVLCMYKATPTCRKRILLSANLLLLLFIKSTSWALEGLHRRQSQYEVLHH